MDSKERSIIEGTKANRKAGAMWGKSGRLEHATKSHHRKKLSLPKKGFLYAYSDRYSCARLGVLNQHDKAWHDKAWFVTFRTPNLDRTLLVLNLSRSLSCVLII